MGQSATMRAMLAQSGIFLDETPAVVNRDVKPENMPEAVDRELVREILVDRGAPAEALEWLVESCPSIEDARKFAPTPWMRRANDDTLAFNPEEIK